MLDRVKEPAVKRSIRASRPEDASAIAALFAAAGMPSNVDTPDLHWKYWQPRTDWPGPRSYVLTDGADLIAHGAFMPGFSLSAGQSIPFAHVIDWVALPGAVGAGAAIMKHIAQQAGSLLAIGGSRDTLRMLPHLGFKPVGVARGMVRTLSPLELVRGIERPTWRTPARVLRSAYWTLVAPTPGAGSWSARRLSSDELGDLAGVLPALDSRPVNDGQDTGADEVHPRLPYSLDATLRRVRRRSSGRILHPGSTPGQTRIVDCFMSSESLGAWRAAVYCAVRAARADPGSAEIVIRSSEPRLTDALSHWGFHARSELPVHVRLASGISQLAEPLRTQLMDNDAAFIHRRGKRDLWA